MKENLTSPLKIRSLDIMGKDETRFQNEFGVALKRTYPKGFWRNLRDTGFHNGRNPFDAFFFIDRDIKLAIEFKKHYLHTAWETRKLEPHQREGLALQETFGHKVFVIIELRSGVHNVAVSIHPDKIVGKSIRPDELLDLADIIHHRRKIELDGAKQTLWDVTQFGKNAETTLFTEVAV